ncbi:hypothetical protein SEPCBS119000_006618 [Sporothrix epigloea]|uniref:Retrotransposon gag domain-containing protein n=1 Tax=Sporothrix epigloea TaxID=1892477 RepID=A0ABP0E3Y1_9PEZI
MPSNGKQPLMMAPLSPPSSSPAVQQMAVAWSPPTFDKIMSGAKIAYAPPPDPMPTWASELHHLAAKTIGDVKELVTATQGQADAVSYYRFDTLRTCYEQIVENLKRLSPRHVAIITDFEFIRQDMIQSCKRFSRSLWADVFCVSQNSDQRSMAIEKLLSTVDAEQIYPRATPRSDESDFLQKLRVLEETVNTLSRTLSAQKAAPQEAPPQVSRPAAYDGKKRDCFPTWWESVTVYFDSLGDIFPNDKAKILWVGTLLAGCALEWHQARVSFMETVCMEDDWQYYASSIRSRFYDSTEPIRNHKEIKALRYEGNICAYFARLEDLNASVGLSGVALRQIIYSALPERLIDLAFDMGDIPESDHELITYFRKVGQRHEELLIRAAPTSDSTSREPRKPHTPRRLPEEHSAGIKKSSHWPNPAAALKGIAQVDIDRFKIAGVSCIRCGRNNHQIGVCFAVKNVNGKNLPIPPNSAGGKRARNDDGKSPKRRPKKARVDAASIKS